MVNCVGACSPIECSLSLDINNICNSHVPDQHLICSLICLLVLTSSDLSYSVSFLNQFINSYNNIEWSYANWGI